MNKPLTWLAFFILAGGCGSSSVASTPEAPPRSLSCSEVQVGISEIDYEGATGEGTPLEAATQELSKDLSEGEVPLALDPEPSRNFGVIRNGELVAKVRTVQVVNGTWLVDRVERCTDS